MGKRCIGEQERRKKERNGREEVEEERVGRWFSCVLENCLPHVAKLSSARAHKKETKSEEKERMQFIFKSFFEFSIL